MLSFDRVSDGEEVLKMKAFFRWLAGLFGHGNGKRSGDGAGPGIVAGDRVHLPGETARFKDVGPTPQELAWERARNADAPTPGKRVGKGSSDLDRLLRKK